MPRNVRGRTMMVAALMIGLAGCDGIFDTGGDGPDPASSIVLTVDPSTLHTTVQNNTGMPIWAEYRSWWLYRRTGSGWENVSRFRYYTAEGPRLHEELKVEPGNHRTWPVLPVFPQELEPGEYRLAVGFLDEHVNWLEQDLVIPARFRIDQE